MKFAKKALTYLTIAGMAVVCALNYQMFVFPNRFAPSGLNGICTMIQYLFGINVGYLSLLINIPLALLVWRKVNKGLAMRSMIYMLSFSVALILLGNVDMSRFAYKTADGTSKILGPLVAGVINGACYSLLVRCSATSGGVDFAAAIIQKRWPELRFFWIIFGLNVVVAMSSYFVYDYQIEPVILCILYSFMSSAVSDSVMKSVRSAIRCEIITDEPDALAQEIIARLHHSATLIPATGVFSGRETNILICVFNRAQFPMLSSIVDNFPGTFVIVSGVNDVLGNFKRLDAKGNLEKHLLDPGDNHIN